MQEEQERSFIQRNLKIIEEATGTRPKGWLSMCLAESFVTPDLLPKRGSVRVKLHARQLPCDAREDGPLLTCLYARDQRVPAIMVRVVRRKCSVR